MSIKYEMSSYQIVKVTFPYKLGHFRVKPLSFTVNNFLSHQKSEKVVFKRHNNISPTIDIIYIENSNNKNVLNNVILFY